MRWHGRRVTIVAPWWSTASRCMRCSHATDLDWSSRTAGRTRNGNTRTSPINGRSHVQKSARSLVSSTRSNVSCRGHFQAMPRHRGCVSNCERSDRVRSSFASGNGPRSKSGLPRSDFGKAVRYMLKRWAGLTRFVEDPRIPLDNNAALRGPSSAARITMGRLAPWNRSRRRLLHALRNRPPGRRRSACISSACRLRGNRPTWDGYVP